MKEFVKILKAKKSQRIEALRSTANIVGKNDPEELLIAIAKLLDSDDE